MIPTPLPNGTSLFGRYLLRGVLGQGGFGITYLAQDGTKEVAIKELAPPGSQRQDDGTLLIPAQSESQRQSLLRAFVDEAQVLRKFTHPGVLRVRDAFLANETAYCVTEYRAGSQSLETILQDRGPFSEPEVRDFLGQLAPVLSAFHAAGYLHRDIKPSNILLDATGRVTLIDFGSARTWQADVTSGHTIVFTPGFAPLEQLSENAKRGPGTDIYGLCATVYTLLTGSPPPAAPERLNEERELELNPHWSLGLRRALVAGLGIQLASRPGSVEEWMAILNDVPAPTSGWAQLLAFDEALVQLRKLRFARFECPECHDAVHAPKPLRPGTCPVCRKGRLLARTFDADACPLCPTGRLKLLRNRDPLVRCPLCRFGILSKASGLVRAGSYRCGGCQATFVVQGKEWVHGETRMLPEDWRKESGRSETLYCCSTCTAEFDLTDRGRWLQVKPSPQMGAYSELFPDEWARVAQGLNPDAGNVRCPECEAEYYAEGGRISLLRASRDPYGFALEYRGQSVVESAVPALAVGKTSGRAGLVCGQCGFEVDQVGSDWDVVRTGSTRLREMVGKPHSWEDLHRVGAGLPTLHEEAEGRDQIPNWLLEAYISGDWELDSRQPEILWRGPGQVKQNRGKVTVTTDEVTLQIGLRKESWDMADFDQIVPTDGGFVLSGEGGELALSLDDLEVSVRLESGTYEFTLHAEDLAEIMQSVLSERFVEAD